MTYDCQELKQALVFLLQDIDGIGNYDLHEEAFLQAIDRLGGDEELAISEPIEEDDYIKALLSILRKMGEL